MKRRHAPVTRNRIRLLEVTVCLHETVSPRAAIVLPLAAIVFPEGNCGAIATHPLIGRTDVACQTAVSGLWDCRPRVS